MIRPPELRGPFSQTLNAQRGLRPNSGGDTPPQETKAERHTPRESTPSGFSTPTLVLANPSHSLIINGGADVNERHEFHSEGQLRSELGALQRLQLSTN